MASAMLTMGQHKAWLRPQRCPRPSPQKEAHHSLVRAYLAHGNHSQNRNGLSSLSSISSFSSRVMRRQLAINVWDLPSGKGLSCYAKLAPGIPTELYVIKKGDWLSDVAAARNMDVYDLKELNPSLDLDNVYVGQKIIVPVMKPIEQPPPPHPPPSPPQLVPSPAPPPLANDTATNTQAREIRVGGNLLGNLFGRQEANAVEPALAAEPEDDFQLEVYTMKRGEWVSSVASRFGVSLDELRAANPNVNLDNVRPKQTILIPRPAAATKSLSRAPSPAADMCAPPPSPPDLTVQPLPDKPSSAADMCVPPTPKQQAPGNVTRQSASKMAATALLDGSGNKKQQQQGQKQQQQEAKKGGGGSNSEADICCPPAPPPSQSMAGAPLASTEVYVVKRGDWMSTVAAERGLSLDELRQLNPGVNLDRIRTGQEILVPRKEAAATAAVPLVADENAPTEYMIQPGDFVDAIAQQHGVSVDDIVELNSLSYEEPIQVGQTIFIPKPKPPAFELAASSSLAPIMGPPPVPPLVVGGLVGVGTALLTIAAVGFALSERAVTGGAAAGKPGGQGSSAKPPGSGQVRGRPMVVTAESSSAAVAEPPAAVPKQPVAQPSSPRPMVSLGGTNGNGNGIGLANGNGAVRAGSESAATARGRGSGVRGSSATLGRLPPEVERATLAAVEAIRGGVQGPGSLRVGDGYARAETVTGALQDAVRSALSSLGSSPPTVALAAISGGREDTDAESYSRTEEAMLHLRKILPRDCTLHGVNAGGGDASPSRDEGSQQWAAVLLLSAPDVIVSSSVALGYGGARLAAQQAIESLASKVSGKKQIKSVVVNASPGLGPTAVEEVGSMLPGVPSYSVGAGKDMATSEWQVIAGPTSSAVSPGVSAIGLTSDAEFGGAFLATVTSQWLYGPRSTVAARPPMVSLSRS